MTSAQMIEIPTGQIRWLVDRHSVGVDDTDIIRDLWRRMRDNPEWTRERRKAAYRFALSCHRENRDLFRAVYTGSL